MIDKRPPSEDRARAECERLASGFPGDPVLVPRDIMIKLMIAAYVSGEVAGVKASLGAAVRHRGAGS